MEDIPILGIVYVTVLFYVMLFVGRAFFGPSGRYELILAALIFFGCWWAPDELFAVAGKVILVALFVFVCWLISNS